MNRSTGGCRSSKRRTFAIAMLSLCVVAAACTSGNSTQAGGESTDTVRVTTTLRSAQPETIPPSEPTTQPPPDTEVTTTTEAETAATPSTTLPGEAVAGGSQFTLISQGAEPRQALRYNVAAGPVTYSVFENQVIVQDIEGVPNLIEIATSLITDFDAEIELDPGGPGTYDLVLSPTDVRAAGSDQLSIDTANLIRDPFSELEIRVTMNDRGIKLAASVIGAESLVALGPEFEQIVDDLTTVEMGAVPLPDVPVGVGARWNVTTDLVVTGFRVIQTATYEIISVDGQTIELEISGSQISDSQSVPNPGLVGSEISVESWDITIEGAATVDLGRLVNPTEVRTGGSQSLVVSQGALEQTVDQTINSEVIVTLSS